MPTERDILNYVLKAAEERGWNQVELAERIGTGKQAITNWISAGRVPDKQLKPLARALGKSVDEILAAGGKVDVIRHAGDRTRLMRMARGLTVDEVASLLGMDTKAYRQLEETGDLPPTTVFLELSRILGVRNPHWLAHGHPVLEIHGSSNSSTPLTQEGGKR